MSNISQKIAIIGGGAFGTALSCISARVGHDCLIFLRDENIASLINRTHQNPARLPDIDIPETVLATSDPERLGDREIVLFAVPAQQTRQAASNLAPFLGKANAIIACAKGLERQSGHYQHQVLAEIFAGKTILALSGPSFAADIAGELPTALTIASRKIEDADRLAHMLASAFFRLYSSDDLIGVETGGALKNVLAIGVGIVRGMRLGASAEAALIARGFSELQRLGIAMGAKRQTLSGLSGLGDLVLTCSSPKSRNFAYGVALGETAPLENLPLAEGVHTARIAAETAKKMRVEAPIIAAVADILDKKVTPIQAVEQLLSRPLRNETG